MSEEIKGKAVEIPDEEMEKVSGGKIAIVTGNKIVSCHAMKSYSEFKHVLDSNKACSHIAPCAPSPSPCLGCGNYGEGDDINFLREMGYQIYDSNGKTL